MLLFCVAGTYCPAGSEAQRSCLPGFYCPLAKKMLACPPGAYCPANSSAPQDCPMGHYCPQTEVDGEIQGISSVSNPVLR